MQGDVGEALALLVDDVDPRRVDVGEDDAKAAPVVVEGEAQLDARHEVGTLVAGDADDVGEERLGLGELPGEDVELVRDALPRLCRERGCGAPEEPDLDGRRDLHGSRVGIRA